MVLLQVVGVVHKGHDVLKLISGQPTDHNDAPLQRIQVRFSWTICCVSAM